MKLSSFVKLSTFGISSIIFKRKSPILGTIIVTDKCNLRCKHCSVNNITSIIYSYSHILGEMEVLYNMGIRILFLCGGETFLWQDGQYNIRDLVIKAKSIGFLIVNVVTNGTFKLDLPEADLILVSLDGDKECHNNIRGDTYDTIINNVKNASSNNICFYMAINKINKNTITSVCEVAKTTKNVRAVSFNFHTPYPDTVELQLSKKEKSECLKIISSLIDKKYPIFNLKTAFPYLIDNSFPSPCYQCVVIENGRISTCGRCIHVKDLCNKCGYFFVAEYTLLFKGNIKIIIEMLKTYLKYV